LVEIYNIELIGETCLQSLILEKELQENVLKILGLSLIEEKMLEVEYIGEFDPLNPPLMSIQPDEA
jgi:hypothetical protein